MSRHHWEIIFLAYILGLLFISASGNFPPVIWILGLGLLTLIAAIFIPRFWRRSPKWKFWLVAGLIAILAGVYFQIRLPQPGINDISKLLKERESGSQLVTVVGKLLSEGKITASQRLQYWFQTEKVSVNKFNNNQKIVTGQLYLTLPESQGKGLVPGQKITVAGVLYLPRSASNPGGFDFQAYLYRQGTFAGLKGYKVLSQDRKPILGLWQIRHRIIEAQTRGLGSPEGLLVSSIVLGQKAVNLSYGIRDLFTQVGLAHVLAASGFQVSLLLGTVVTLTGRFSRRSQFIIGLLILLIYLGLTGIQPSVMRAVIMGIAVLIALVSDRKIRPLGSLLFAATLLLLFKPIWIVDLGFQLSFLATFGLIVTLPALKQRLDWLPSKVADAVAIPLAASLWTFPLLMHIFSIIALYSIPLNIIVAPLVIAISLGGVVSAVAALIFPSLGSAIAWLLYYPTHLLIEIAKFFIHLPANNLAVGKISLGILLLIYTLMILIWLQQWWQRHWWLGGLLIISLILFPITYQQFNLVQVTILADDKEPILVIQDRGKASLINSGSGEIVKYTILPFLAQQAINRLSCAVTFAIPVTQDIGLSQLQAHLPIQQILSFGNQSSGNCHNINLIRVNPPLLQLTLDKQTWVLIDGKISPEVLPRNALNLKPKVLIWTGKFLSQDWLNRMEPEIAIAVSSNVDAETQKQLQQRQIPLYWTGRDGAIQWTPEQGFQKGQTHLNSGLF